MIFDNKVYVIFVDEKFVGICENENEIWDIAQNEVNGTNYPLTDDNFADRVFWNTIKPNRFYKHSKNVCDKIYKNGLLCSSHQEAEKGVNAFNKLNLQRERAEARVRALLL